MILNGYKEVKQFTFSCNTLKSRKQPPPNISHLLANTDFLPYKPPTNNLWSELQTQALSLSKTGRCVKYYRKIQNINPGLVDVFKHIFRAYIRGEGVLPFRWGYIRSILCQYLNHYISKISIFQAKRSSYQTKPPLFALKLT